MSCPGLSVRGKEGESVTPQERAAQMIKELFSLHLDDNGEADITDIAAIVDLVQATRRAALLECLDIARTDGNIIAVRERLTKLAQEGASSIDLSPTIKDDGGYGEHF